MIGITLFLLKPASTTKFFLTLAEEFWEAAQLQVGKIYLTSVIDADLCNIKTTWYINMVQVKITTNLRLTQAILDGHGAT